MTDLTPEDVHRLALAHERAEPWGYRDRERILAVLSEVAARRHENHGVLVTGDAGLDAAWRAVEAVLPKSKGPWGYSIHGLKYTTRGWCAIAAGARTGEWVEGFGATPVDALNALRVALTGDTTERAR